MLFVWLLGSDLSLKQVGFRGEKILYRVAGAMLRDMVKRGEGRFPPDADYGYLAVALLRIGAAYLDPQSRN